MIVKEVYFIDYLKRDKVETDSDFTSYVWYIHNNAVHHGYTRALGEWKFDSYSTMISDAPTAIMREEVLNWFGNIEKFIEFHQQRNYVKFPILDTD